MAVQASKSISLTILSSGKTFKLSADNIINFTVVNGSNTQLTYLNNRDNVVTAIVSQSVSTINTAAVRTQAVTLNNAASTVIYIHSDKIIYIDDSTSFRQITYNGSGSYPTIYDVTESAASINTAAGNTFIITIQQSSLSRWINNLYVNTVVSEDIISSASITFTTEVLIGSGVVVSGGSGYTAPTVSITGGGGTGATGTVTTELLSAALNVAGSGYAPADTITLAGGTFSTAAILTIAKTQLVSAAINAGGTNYVNGDTITLAGGTFTSAAIITVDTVDGGGAILTFTISTPGSYSVNTTSFTQGSTSGIGSGATFNTALFGVDTFTVSTAGSYSVNSASLTQGSTTGGGTSATFNTAIFGIEAFTITATGTGYTSYPTFTVVDLDGNSAIITASVDVESPLTIVNPGANYNTVPTLTFSATSGTLATATATIDGVTGEINGTTLTNAGSYESGTDAYPTLVVSGGAGAQIYYDIQGTELYVLQVAETAADIQTAINAL